MASFGELVLVLGDLHVPGRANSIPEQFKRMLVPDKMQHVICTGNVGIDHLNEFRILAPNVHLVAGDHDDESLGFPDSKVIQVGQFRIGIIHGHQILPHRSTDAQARMRRKMNVDILILGHSHQNEVTLHDNCYHINPGSITGAFSTQVEEIVPSFILLSIQEAKLVCYVYELINNEVEVSKTEFTKNGREASSPALLQSLLS